MDSIQSYPLHTKRGPKTCTMLNCGTKVRARGLCNKHYKRWQVHGDPNAFLPVRHKGCAVDGCDKPVRSRDMCGMHYCRWLKHGDPLITKHRVGCSVDGCSRPHYGRGFCGVHLKRWRTWGDPHVTYGHHPATEVRFWSKVNKKGSMPPQSVAPGLCWEWTGAKTTGGYGQFWVKPRLVVTHRFAYELLVGEIPAGLQLDHLCRNRPCVNPVHLEPVTQQVNILRGFSVATANRLKTHCPKGHPYSADNTYIHPKNNGRICRTCNRERSRANYEKRKTA